MAKLTGRIKSYDQRRGFGFIIPDKQIEPVDPNKRDIFFHVLQCDLATQKLLNTGHYHQRPVRFETYMKNQSKAHAVELVT